MHIITWILVLVSVPRNCRMVFVVTPYVPELIMISMLMQYSIVLNLVHRLMEIVNANIFYISQYSGKSEDNKITVIKNIKNGRLFKKEFSQFSQLRELHHLLCDVSEDLEKFYSRLVLLCITYIFGSLILCSYFNTKKLLREGEKVMTIEATFFFVVTMILYITPLVNLTRSASAVIAEVINFVCMNEK